MNALYHSFPRFASSSKNELDVGWEVLVSILDRGLILTHEKIRFPFVTQTNIDFHSGSTVDQLRCCFTFLIASEILHHSAAFGAYSLEFEVEDLREIGAFPVIYVPQPLVDAQHNLREVSIIGNQLVHQLRDVAILLEELVGLQTIFEQNRDRKDLEIEVQTQRRSGKMRFSAIDLIVDHLLGSKVSFSNLLHSIQFMTNMFYHVDSTRPELLSLDHDTHYYLQREWRIVSGLMEGHMDVDDPLTEDDVQYLEKINPAFAKEVTLRNGSMSPHSHVIRKIAGTRKGPLWKSVRAFYVPDVMFDQAKAEFERRGMPASLLKALDYAELLAIRERTTARTERKRR
ncbi:hypothetical protein [Bradyrhizobium sp. Ai1a-2]|uniref:hypothetical protein n=1 Tax=Bradyrhizobium sp. Ai1a-2 TaxID=196490 RepID=UPI000A06EA8D|nr:hypothetical protein [Bradyrhizobium sp. Ai1a-2]